MKFLNEAIQRLSKYFSFIGIETYTLSKENYRILQKSGLTNVTMYQETYDEIRYKEVHVSGPKASYHKRLKGIEAAAASGIQNIQLGVLLGLGPSVYDIYNLGLHASYLINKYPGIELALSLPRLQNTPVSFSGGGVC